MPASTSRERFYYTFVVEAAMYIAFIHLQNSWEKKSYSVDNGKFPWWMWLTIKWRFNNNKISNAVMRKTIKGWWKQRSRYGGIALYQQFLIKQRSWEMAEDEMIWRILLSKWNSLKYISCIRLELRSFRHAHSSMIHFFLMCLDWMQ